MDLRYLWRLSSAAAVSLFEHFPVFPVTLITAPGILLVRCIVEWLHSGEIAEAFWSYSPEMFFHLMYGGLFAIYVRFFRSGIFVWNSSCRFWELMSSPTLPKFCSSGNRCTDHSGFAAVGDCGNWQNGSGSCVAGILDAYGLSILRKDDRIRYRKLLLLTSQLKSEVI